MNGSPPPPPRETTSHIRSRSWKEPRVLGWWLATFFLLLAVVFLIIREYIDWRSDNWIIKNGTPVEATITRTMTSDGATSAVPGNRVLPGANVALKFQWAGGSKEVIGPLGNQNNYLRIGSTLPIRVDPKNPDRWTAMTELPPIAPKLVFSLIPLVFAIGAALYAWRATSRMLRLWKNGEACRAVIVKQRTTALAPSAYVVDCAFQDDVNDQLVTAHLPKKSLPEDGVIWLLVMPQNLKTAVAAAWFD